MFRHSPFAAAFLIAATCALGQTDVYHPYRFVDKWDADTLYLGASFRYNGKGPLKITLKWSETSTDGDLYVISPVTGEPVFLMTNRMPEGTEINLSAMFPFKAGDEVVFQYAPKFPGVTPRFTGPNLPGRRFFTPASSDGNPNPRLRFGHRFSVAGKTDAGLIEFGFEDTNGDFADMDFNDIHYTLANADLLLYQNTAKKRAYVW